MKLALSTVLPPSRTDQAAWGAALLPALRRQGLRATLVDNPFRVRAGLCPEGELHALAELPHLMATEAVDLPVYLLGDHLEHLHQLRYLLLCPGLVVLPELELAGLAAALAVPVGPRRIPFVPGIDSAGDLLPVLAGASRGVVVPAPELADRLAPLCGDTPVFVLPALAAGSLDAEAAAAGLRAVAAKLPPGPRLRMPEAGSSPPVAAVVVTYNSRQIVDPCLRSLLEQDYPELEVIVVDNASADGTAEHVRRSFPSVRVLEPGTNLGFAGGNNHAFARSNADYFVLLNQDATARRDMVSELVRVAELDRSIAAVGAKMLMDRSPTILNSTGTEINEGGWAWDRGIGQRDDDPSPLPDEVFAVCGGAMLLRRQALLDAGAFDERFFMYYEDTDLCWRLRLAGYRVYHAPLAVVRHAFHGDAAGAPGRAARRRFLSERNRLQTLIKNCDFANLRRVWGRIRRQDSERLRWLERAVRDGYNPDHYREIAREIRRARRYVLWHLPGLWRRRRRVQKLVRVPVEEVRRLIRPGVHEGGHQGDYESYHDRFSAARRAAFAIGEGDDGCLGSGWHALEDPPNADRPYRWTGGRAWFYLQPAAGATAVVLRAASPIEPQDVELFAEDLSLGRQRVAGEAREYAFPLPSELPRDTLLEFRLESGTVRPADRGLGRDRRELGVLVTGIATGPAAAAAEKAAAGPDESE